jgi:hypothetical protein
MRGMMPGSEQPVMSSTATEKSGSQSANARSAQEYSRATSGTTRPRKTPLGAKMSVLVPSSEDQAGPATKRPPQKKVCQASAERQRTRRAAQAAQALRSRTHVVAGPVLVDAPPAACVGRMRERHFVRPPTLSQRRSRSVVARADGAEAARGELEGLGPAARREGTRGDRRLRRGRHDDGRGSLATVGGPTRAAADFSTAHPRAEAARCKPPGAAPRVLRRVVRKGRCTTAFLLQQARRSAHACFALVPAAPHAAAARCLCHRRRRTFFAIILR